MEQEKLVSNIKRICGEKGISISTMEKDLLFSQGLISRWSRMNPSITKIISVADYLGVSLDELVGRKEVVQQTSFLEKLLNATKNNSLSWKPLGCKKEFLHPLQFFKEIREVDWVCGYCEFGEAYFLIEGYVDDDDKVENLSIYIIPDLDSAPVLQNIDEEEVLLLFDEIRQDITWKYDIDGAERVKQHFINDSSM